MAQPIPGPTSPGNGVKLGTTSVGTEPVINRSGLAKVYFNASGNLEDGAGSCLSSAELFTACETGNPAALRCEVARQSAPGEGSTSKSSAGGVSDLPD